MIFVQDSAQLEKLNGNISYTTALIFWYVGNKITKIQSSTGQAYGILNFPLILYKMITADEYVCEYANFIPRIFSIIFRKRLHAHVFGVLTVSSFVRNNRIKLIGKMNTQYADKFSIYGENNETKDMHEFLSSIANVEYKTRKDIQDLSQYPESRFILFISQPWKELGYLRYSRFEREVYNCLIRNGYKVVVCIHPRGPSVNGIVSQHRVHGYAEAIKYIQSNGRPICALTLSSSMAHELIQMGVSAATMLEGDFMDAKEECEISRSDVANLGKLSDDFIKCLASVK